MEWNDDELEKNNAMKLKKYICPKCKYVNPIMELINTANCLNKINGRNCGVFVDLVKDGYVILSNNDWSIIEISEE